VRRGKELRSMSEPWWLGIGLIGAVVGIGALKKRRGIRPTSQVDFLPKSGEI